MQFINIGSYLMNIKQVARLLNDIGVETVATDTSLGPDVDYGVNYYMLKLNNETGKWEFLFMQRERQNSGDQHLIKNFDDKAEVIKYYYLFQLSSFFFNECVQTFELKNKDINIGWPNFNLENLREALKRLDIDPSYYSLDGKVKEHSMLLEKVNKEESKLYFIGQNKKVVNASLAQENWQIYSAMYQRVYFLYLLDQHYADLIKNNEIGHIFTDEDYKTV